MMPRYEYGLDILGSLSPGELKMDPSLSASTDKTPQQLATQSEPLTSDKDVKAAYSYWEDKPAPDTSDQMRDPYPASAESRPFIPSNAAQGGNLSFSSQPQQQRGGLGTPELQMDPSLSSPGYQSQPQPQPQPSYAAPSRQPRPQAQPSYQQQPQQQPYAQQQQPPQQQQQPSGDSGGGFTTAMPIVSSLTSGIASYAEQQQAKTEVERQRQAEERRQVEAKQRDEYQRQAAAVEATNAANAERQRAAQQERAAAVAAKQAADLAKIKPSPENARRLAAAQKNLAAAQALLAKSRPKPVVQVPVMQAGFFSSFAAPGGLPTWVKVAGALTGMTIVFAGIHYVFERK